MRYGDSQFAKHSSFCYFALNTEMRWHALQTGRIFINQHQKDAHLTLELKDMVGREGEEFFSNRVLHYAGSLHGTGQYWFKQRSRLISMVDALGLPTVFITHSAADTQWPELAKLIYQMTSTAVPAGMLPLQTIQRSRTVFLLTGSTSSSMPSTLLFVVQRQSFRTSPSCSL